MQERKSIGLENNVLAARTPKAPRTVDLLEGEVLLGEREASVYLAVTVYTLQCWRKKSERRGPRFVKLGKLVRYRLADLRAYVKGRTIQTRDKT